ncbi:MAG: PQQ-dependent sugar dehydrogenase [Chloroflexi bacterium]|nr:PQQ-dependent sugar dehydrogenase [Chloroflexota bacterium]
MRIDEPQFNHNAGAVNFGPDSRLYISLGDGGGADDLDGQAFIGGPIIGHGTGNGQDPSNVLGTVLRIDPAGSNSANGQYGIPADNPFVGVGGFVDEIYAYGFRNPFRFSFDQSSGTMYIADVGQNDIEEIDIGASGRNYGWNHKEGSFFFDANGNDSGFVTNTDPGVPPGLTDPIAEYDHDEGIAIVGGFVYRGSDLPGLNGKYVFGDFAQSFNNDGRLFHLEGGQIVEFQLSDRTALNLSLLGFGQDADGEVYVLANGTGTPFGTTGVVLKLAPPQPGGPPAVGGVAGLLDGDGSQAAETAASIGSGLTLPLATGLAAAITVALATAWFVRRRTTA